MRSIYIAFITSYLMLVPMAMRCQSMAPMPTTYSASIQVEGAGGRAITEKVYRDGDKFRVDPQMAGQPAMMHMIMLLSSHKAYTVMPQSNMCFESQIGPRQSPAMLSSDVSHPVSVTDLGSGTFDGRSCDIKKVVYKDQAGAEKEATVWLAKDLQNFPVKITTQTLKGQTMTLDYKDISLAKPDPALFATPPNCRMMPSMGGMPVGH